MNIDTGIAISISSAITTIAGTIAWVAPKLKRLNYLFDDWNGEPARPGVPRRMGVMERLEQIENKLDGIPSDKNVKKLDELINNLIEELRNKNEKRDEKRDAHSNGA